MIALTHSQLQQIKTCAFQLPYHLRDRFHRRVSELLPRDFGDADVWRAAHAAARETWRAPEKGFAASPEHVILRS